MATEPLYGKKEHVRYAVPWKEQTGIICACGHDWGRHAEMIKVSLDRDGFLPSEPYFGNCGDCTCQYAATDNLDWLAKNRG